MRGKVKGAGRQLSGADDDLDFRIIASLVQPLQHAGLLTNQGRRRLMLFLAPSWLVAKTNLWPCRGKGKKQHRPREATVSAGLG